MAEKTTFQHQVDSAIPALLSIHDVMPETVDKVLAIIARLREAEVTAITLLVVPGRKWSAAQLARLHTVNEGADIQLAGHGWVHECTRIRGLKHRLHSLLFSRKVAEHLALARGDIPAFIQRNFDWFEGHFFPAPQLYVPPAWAMGRISTRQLADLPFRYYETLREVYDSETGVRHRTPIVGYEADAFHRKVAVRIWNGRNVRAVTATAPLRISIHPGDFELLLANDIMTHIEQVTAWWFYSDLGHKE